MKRLLQLPFAVAIALAGADASALGLGAVHVSSGLNQPLNAEIPVITGSAAEADGLVAQLASDEEFGRVGLSRSRIGVPLTFKVVKTKRGGVIIKVTSEEPVRQTFIDFLVEANWPKGRVLREYTVLLDPPVTAPVSQPVVSSGPGSVRIVRPTAKPVPAAARPAPAIAANAAAPPPVQAATPPAPSRQATASAPTNTAADGEYGPVEPGDNLISIARARQLDNVNLDQMMLALLKANPNAFYKPNINALKRGAILRMPSADEARNAGSVGKAAAQVRSQIEDWRGVRAAPTLVADAQANAPVAPSAPNAKAKSSGDRARLELVPPKSGNADTASAGSPGSGTDAGATKGTRADLSRTREALASAQQESTDLKARVGELETIKEKNDRLLSLKDSEIADLQGKLKALQDANGKQSTTATAEASGESASAMAASDANHESVTPGRTIAPAPVTDSAAANPVVTTDAKAAPSVQSPASMSESTPQAKLEQPASASATASPATNPPSSMTTAQPVAAPLPATTPAPKPVPPAPKPNVASAKAAPSSAMDNLMQQSWFIPAALAGGALLVLLLVLSLRRRAAAQKPRSSLATAFGDSSLSPSGSEHASDLSVDDLRNQLANNPGNAGLYLELLSIHYAEHDVAAFEADAEDMHAHIADENGPEWREAQAMGRELAPANPLFHSTAQDTRAVGLAAVASGAAAFGMQHEGDAPVHDDTVVRNEHPFGFDRAREGEAIVDHGVSTDTSRTSHPFADDEFARDDASPAFPAEAHATIETMHADSQVHPFGFDLDSERDSFVPSPQDRLEPGMPADIHEDHLLDFEPASAETSHTHIAGLDAAVADDHRLEPFAEPRAAYDFPGSDDAISTKLDLARAYVDMGDPDGARAMLGEVVAEGSAVQKTEAERLLADLG